MLKNYWIIALRNLTRNKIYSIINIAGLAIGMAVALLIGLWVWDELTFNHSYRNHDRIAVVLAQQEVNGDITTDWSADMPLEKELRTQYAGDFRHLALASGYEPHILSAGNKKLEGTCRWAGAELPEMFSAHMLEGNIRGLEDPSSTLLTASMAHALFGNADPIGQTIRLDNDLTFKVAGVYEDFAVNSVFHRVTFFLPWAKYVDTHAWVKNTQDQWGNGFAVLYTELNNAAGLDRVNNHIRLIVQKHVPGSKETLSLFPMDKWHLYSFEHGQLTAKAMHFVWLFSSIALAVLLLACINFMNLATARSEKRAREVGIRKTLGSLRQQLIGQFLGESLFMTFCALVAGLLLASLLMPLFNQLAKKDLSIPWNEPVFWLLALGFTLFTGLISGSYPAFYLSSFQPVKVLKGALRVGKSASLPRKILVTVQFTVSVILIMGTLIVYRQIRYAHDRPLGFKREGLLTVNILNDPGLKPHFAAIRSDLLSSGAAIGVMGSSGSTVDDWGMRGGLSWKGKDPYSKPQFAWNSATHDFGKTLGWQILEGHAPVPGVRSDSLGLILNESAVRLAGLQHPIGQLITVDSFPRPVIAVVKDMIRNSPYDAVIPAIFFMDYNWMNYITLRLNPSMPQVDAIARVQKVFRQYDPEGVISYEIPEETYEFKFAAEKRIGSIATFFTILAIFISCLGLFGLASFMAEQRTREIGIRKILGASVFNLWSTLSREFVVLVLAASAVAIPVSAYFLHQWLLQYTYRASLSWWLFALAVGGALVVTILTVSYQTIRAALANPTKSLRSE